MVTLTRKTCFMDIRMAATQYNSNLYHFALRIFLIHKASKIIDKIDYAKFLKKVENFKILQNFDRFLLKIFRKSTQQAAKILATWPKQKTLYFLSSMYSNNWAWLKGGRIFKH